MQTDQLLDNVTNVGFVFCIAAEKPSAPAGYRAERIQSYLTHHGETQVDTGSERFLRMIAPLPPAPLADAASHPDLSEAVRRQHEARIACALRSVDTETPPLTGETVEKDEFTYLTAPFNGCPERTAVLHRTTSYGELLYLFPGVTVDSAGRLLFQAPSSPGRSRVVPLPFEAAFLASASGVAPPVTAALGSVATTIAEGIASEMLSAVGGAIVGSLMEEIFPPGVLSYFDQVYEQMKEIVGAGLQQTTIEQIDGAINSIRDHLDTEYRPARQGKDLNRLEHRQSLFSLLQKYEATYLSGPGGMLGTLMADKYAKPGFSAFLLGAGLHLVLYQEMANVDPSNRASSGEFRGPLESSYGRPGNGTIALSAARYAGFAEKIWPQILADRAGKIYRKEGIRCAAGDISGGSCRSYVWFRDNLEPGDAYVPGTWPSKDNRVNEIIQTREDKDGNSPQRDQLIKRYDAYVKRKLEELTRSLSDPAAIAASWRQLVTTPIRVS